MRTIIWLLGTEFILLTAMYWGLYEEVYEGSIGFAMMLLLVLFFAIYLDIKEAVKGK